MKLESNKSGNFIIGQLGIAFAVLILILLAAREHIIEKRRGRK